jgi:tripartite-type tricarboxylate transporter receptor subunit TctC
MMVRILAAALLWGLAALGGAHAQSWPSKPIRWIIPYPPGGGTDLVSRTITIQLAEA